MTVLNVDKLTKYYGARAIFEGVSFTVGRKERVAVIGRNGEGKTTLLRVIAGELEADGGVSSILGKKTVGYLSQGAPTFSSTVLTEALSWNQNAAALEKKMRELEEKMSLTGEVMDEYAAVTARFEAMDGYNMENRAKAVLLGLGFCKDSFHKEASILSGGERVRLALAKILLLEPDLMILDEPTNHIDIFGIQWLEEFLKSYKGAVLFVSHDRYFIDSIAGKIVELDGGKSLVFSGNYSDYLSEKNAYLKTQADAYAKQQELILRTRKWIGRFKANANLATMAKSREKMLGRLELLEKPKVKKIIRGVKFRESKRSGSEVLKMESFSKGYPVRGDGSGFNWLFKDFTHVLRRGDKVALIGLNGCGKTTFIRAILGLDRRYEGKVVLGQNVIVGYFSQGLDDLRDENTLRMEMKGVGLENKEARDILGRFLFSGEDAEKKVGALSGGERNRLVLAKLVVGKANLLVLDEPTNHLDMVSKEALEGALEDFPGTVLFASHDRFFIEKVSKELWIFEDSRIKIFKGKYSDYKNKVLSEKPIRYENEDFSKATEGGEVKEKDLRKENTRGRKKVPHCDEERARQKKIQSRRQNLEEIEALIFSLEQKKSEFTLLFSDPKSYHEAQNLPWKEFNDIEKELAELYGQWDALSSLLEDTPN